MKINYFINFIKSYYKIFFKVFYYEIFYSIKFKEIIPQIKVQNNSRRTDTVPSVYYFLHEISKFIKKKNIKAVIDIGSGYGRVVNFISTINNIKCYGIEYDKEVFNSANKNKKNNVTLYCADVLNFNFKKIKSNSFILVDPFQKIKDRNKFLNKIRKTYPKEKKYIFAINNYKGKFPKNYKLIYSIIGSKTRTLKIFETF